MKEPLFTRNVAVVLLVVVLARAADASSTLLGMKSSAGMADFTWEATTALMETTSGTAGLGSASTMAEPSGMQTQSAITMDTTVFVAPSTQVEVFSAPGSMMSTSVESVSTTLEPSSIPTEPSIAPGSVRLVDGTGPHEGRVEIFYNDTWGTVCDNNWSLNDGLVVCRQLGYPGVLRVYKGAHFGEGTGPILLDNLICKGTEDNLTQCPNGEVNCDHSEDAGVTCARETVSPSSTIATKGPTANSSVLPLATSILSSTLMEMTSAPMVVTSTMLEPSNIPTEPSPASGSVRLVDGTGSHEGRVEIFYNDTWGTVCDNHWSLKDGLVVCRQLGYPGILIVYKRAHFGEGTGPILFDNLICKGTEDNLTQCPNGEVNCDHSEDAGVTCARETVSPSSMVKEPTASTSALPSPDFMLPSTQDVQSTLTVVTPSIPIATPVITPSTSVITSTPPVTDSTTAAATPSSTTASTQPSTSPTPVNVQTPTGVTVSTPPVTDGAVRITLMWSKPGNASGLTGYQIRYSWESKWDPSRVVKRQSERKTMSVTVTDASYTLKDVEGFAEYCFAVSALYEGGDESPATAEQCTTTPETKPSPPLHLRQVHSSVTSSSVRLQWDAPDRPNGNIKHFKVYYQQGSSRQYQVSDWQGQGYVVLDGLDPNTEYYVKVTAVTDTFESDASNGLRVVTLHVATSATGTPGWVVPVIVIVILLLICIIVATVLLGCALCCILGRREAKYNLFEQGKPSTLLPVIEDAETKV